MRRDLWVPLLLVCAGAAAPAAGVDGRLCDERLKPIPSSFGYALRGAQTRCEGLYESSVRAVGLEVVAFLYGRLDFDLNRHDHLKIYAPDVSDLADQPVRVRAVALPLKAYYRMDAVLPEGGDDAGPLVWPLGDVVRPAGLTAEQIGVFGWIGEETDKIFVPLRVAPVDGPVQEEGGGARGDGGSETNPRLSIRLAGNAETVLWRFKEGDATSGWAPAAGGPMSAGRIIRLELPAGKAARLRIDVQAKRPDIDEWSSLRFDVIRPAP